jgi:hypothetical protein
MATGEADGDTASAIAEALDELGLPYEHPEAGAYLVKLQGTHKLATMTWLIAGQHSLQVEAFFCRQPDENHAEFYRFLLTKSARMYGVHFALDKLGDVYLTGRLPLGSVGVDELDRLLGCVLSYCDETFDEALKIGFGSAIRREWAWRTKRGESLANLMPFKSLIEGDALWATCRRWRASARPARWRCTTSPSTSAFMFTSPCTCRSTTCCASYSRS